MRARLTSCERKVSERERFYIEANYYTNATGELEKAAQVYELWQQTYQRDHVPHANLGVHLRQSLETGKRHWKNSGRQLRLEPSNDVGYANLSDAYLSLNRLDDAEAVYKADGRAQTGE